LVGISFTLGEHIPVQSILITGAALLDVGGSLTVQLFGSSPTNNSGETELPKGELEDKVLSSDESSFSASPVVIGSEKERFRMPKK